ncbi:MAG: alpha/beta hydrolase [Promethearchaeota archaeon]|nr:MAG: alpha/beta hydrolase [Candidatus Lokiarchaeota archaeon]
MEFENKQFDGPYEVSEIQIEQMLRGVLYFPPQSFKKPYPLIIYFHGFPQVFPLTEFIKRYKSMLDIGYSLLVFNFRGYGYNAGKISISSQVSDAFRVIEFVQKMAEHDIFDLNNINIIAHDFGAYIALILCSKVTVVNKLLLISPIIELKKRINGEDFKKALHYINRFLPRSIHGIGNIEQFIHMTKNELQIEEFQIEKCIPKLKNKQLKIIIGEMDKVMPVVEAKKILRGANLAPDIFIVNKMDHECIQDEDFKKINEEVLKFLKIN